MFPHLETLKYTCLDRCCTLVVVFKFIILNSKLNSVMLCDSLKMRYAHGRAYDPLPWASTNHVTYTRQGQQHYMPITLRSEYLHPIWFSSSLNRQNNGGFRGIYRDIARACEGSAL